MSAALPYCEIVEVDDSDCSPHTYTGFFQAGAAPTDFDSWMSASVRPSHGELVSSLRYAPDSLRVYDENAGEWREVASTSLGRLDSGLCLTPEFVTARDSSGLRSTALGPDSTECADWVVVSSRHFPEDYQSYPPTCVWGTTARNRLMEYMPGKVLAWDIGSQPGDPEEVRAALRHVVERNRAWNLWQMALPPQQRRLFSESPELVIVGGPGECYEWPSLVNVSVAYDSTGGFLSDGGMAAPWSLYPDSVCVPYTRIPAVSLEEVDATFDAAHEYSNMVNVDPLQRTILVAGNVYSFAHECEGLTGNGPIAFLDEIGSYIEHPSYPMIVQSTCPEEQTLTDYVNAGASLYISVGFAADPRTWPAGRWTWPYSYTKRQVMAVIVPCCNTMDVIRFPADPPSSQPRVTKMMYNDEDWTRFAFATGFIPGGYYLNQEAWTRYLVKEIDEHRDEGLTWERVIFQAQQEMGEDTGLWRMLKGVGNVGAPCRVPVGLTSAVDMRSPGIEKLATRSWPNPVVSREASVVEFRLPVRGVVTVRVLDLQGRLVATLTEDVYEAGVHTVRWNGSDDGGRHVAAGVYFARVECESGVVVSRIVRVK